MDRRRLAKISLGALAGLGLATAAVLDLAPVLRERLPLPRSIPAIMSAAGTGARRASRPTSKKVMTGLKTARPSLTEILYSTGLRNRPHKKNCAPRLKAEEDRTTAAAASTGPAPSPESAPARSPAPALRRAASSAPEAAASSARALG